jgi:hypothetical protein
MKTTKKDYVNLLRILFVGTGILFALKTATDASVDWGSLFTLGLVYVTFDLTLCFLASCFFSPQFVKACLLGATILIVPTVLSTAMSVLTSNHYANSHGGEQALVAYAEAARKSAEQEIEAGSSPGVKKAALDRLKEATERVDETGVVDKSVAMDAYFAKSTGLELETIASIKYLCLGLAFILSYIAVNGWLAVEQDQQTRTETREEPRISPQIEEPKFEMPIIEKDYPPVFHRAHTI